jgi:hypothetical protein
MTVADAGVGEVVHGARRLGVGVAARHPPARGEQQLPHQDAAVGVSRGRADGDLLAAQRVDDDVGPGGRLVS